MRETSWTVTLHTGPNQWSTITVEARDHVAAGRIAQRLLGAHPIASIE